MRDIGIDAVVVDVPFRQMRHEVNQDDPALLEAALNHLRDETLQKLANGGISEKFIAETPARSSRAGDFQ